MHYKAYDACSLHHDRNQCRMYLRVKFTAAIWWVCLTRESCAAPEMPKSVDRHEKSSDNRRAVCTS